MLKKTGYKLTIGIDPNNFRLNKSGILEARWGRRTWVELTEKYNANLFKGLNTIQCETRSLSEKIKVLAIIGRVKEK